MGSKQLYAYTIFLQITRNISLKAEDVREQMKTNIKNEFRRYGGAVAMDCWMDAGTKTTYFGLTIHYISNINNELILNDRVLVIRELAAEKEKTGEYLRTKIIEYLKEFELFDCVEKNLVFISDRGKNIVRALSEC